MADLAGDPACLLLAADQKCFVPLQYWLPAANNFNGSHGRVCRDEEKLKLIDGPARNECAAPGVFFFFFW